jgi:hypothetical protein
MEKAMTELQLATSRFHAPERITASGLVPVGIVVSPPRWPLRFEPAGNLTPLAPVGLREIEDRDEFERGYVERLERFGVERTRTILRGFADAYEAPGCVLLCFENLDKPGEWCHRRMFAAWWEAQTGQAVPELEAAPRLFVPIA